MDKKKGPKSKIVNESKNRSFECQPDDEDCEAFFESEPDVPEVRERRKVWERDYDEYDDLEE